MRSTPLTATLVAITLFVSGSVVTPVLAQSDRGGEPTLRQRLDQDRSTRPSETRRPARTGRSDSDRQIRRLMMIEQDRRQANQPRSVPVQPKRNGSSVVVTQ